MILCGLDNINQAPQSEISTFDAIAYTLRSICCGHRRHLVCQVRPVVSVMAELRLPPLPDRGLEPADSPFVAEPAALPFDSVGAMEEK